jgi:hypothetical protein
LHFYMLFFPADVIILCVFLSQMRGRLEQDLFGWATGPLASFASCLCVNTCMELSRVLLAIGCSCKSLGKYFFDKWLLTPVFFYIYIYIYNIFMVTSYPFKGKTPMVWRICHRLMLKVDCCGWFLLYKLLFWWLKSDFEKIYFF